MQYPGIPMLRFGSVPEEYGGGSLYRLIWAPSRSVVLTGKERTMKVPMYAGNLAIQPIQPSGDVWILEKWKAPWEITNLSKKQWNADQDMLNMGPYPARGDYVLCEVLACEPANANIEKLITWIEQGAKRSPQENRTAIVENMQRQMRDRHNERHARILNRLLPFGGEAYAAAGGGRGTKTIEMKHSANDLGLPTQSGYTGVSPVHKPVKFEVPNAGMES